MEIAVVVPDYAWAFDVLSVIEVFDGTIPEGIPAPHHLSFVSTGNIARMDHGLSMQTIPIGQYERTPDLIIVSGFAEPDPLFASGASSLENEDLPFERLEELRRLVRWIRECSLRGTEIASLCTGVLILGWAGLLDDIPCTTHWRFADGLKRLFPRALVQGDRLFTHAQDKRIWTCAGGEICIDLCMSLLAAHAGQSTANSVRNMMLLHVPLAPDARQGGNAPHPASSDHQEDIRRLLGTVRENLSRQWTLPVLASSVCMSPRTFQRHFQSFTGTSPLRWLANERVHAALELLELTDLPLSAIAARTGFGSADRMRSAFNAASLKSPSSYKTGKTPGSEQIPPTRPGASLIYEPAPRETAGTDAD